MTLGELIAVLEKAPPDRKVVFGFREPHSHRGNYKDLAFVPAKNTTVGEMLKIARKALGSAFEGWKGGDFTMDNHTDVYLSKVGESGEQIGSALLSFMIGEEPRLVCWHCHGTGRLKYWE